MECDSDKRGLCAACVALGVTLELNRYTRKSQSLQQETFSVQVFYKIHFLGLLLSFLVGCQDRKKKFSYALDNILIFKLMRKKPQATTEKIQASLSHLTAPVMQHALHCAEQHGSKH